VGDARLRRMLTRWLIRDNLVSIGRAAAITGRAGSPAIVRYMALGREEES